MSYATKVFTSVCAAVTCLVAAVMLGFFHLWWVAGVLGIAGIFGWVVAVRIARSGSESERREFVDAGERAIGAGGRAQGGGWSPRRRRGE